MEHLSKAIMVRFKRIARLVKRSVMASFQLDICPMLVLILLKRLLISSPLWGRDRLRLGAWCLDVGLGRAPPGGGQSGADVCFREIQLFCW